MHLSHLSFCTLALLLMTSANAFSDSFDSDIYAGLQLGHGSFHYDNQSIPDDEDDRNFMGGLSLGYRITPYLATELNYQFLGEAEKQSNNKDASIDLNQVTLLGKITYPITPRLEPYLKLGVSNWFGKENNQSISGLSPAVAAGLQYSITPRVQLGVTYQHIDSIGNSEDIAHSSVFFETNFRFGKSNYSVASIAEQPYDGELDTKVIADVVTKSDSTFSVAFSFDSAEVTDMKTIKNLADKMKTNDSLIAYIYGYASPVGKTQYNDVLSQKRADAVKAKLIEQDITPERLVSFGKGEDRTPVSPISLGQRADVVIKVE